MQRLPEKFFDVANSNCFNYLMKFKNVRTLKNENYSWIIKHSSIRVEVGA